MARAGRRLRAAAKLWHRLFGFVLGGWLLLLAVTGAAMAFYDELDVWLNPDLRTVAPAAAVAPLDVVAAQAAEAIPGFAPSQIDLPNAPGRSIWMIGRAPGPDGAPRPLQVFADPASGQVLGWRQSGAVKLDRRHLPDLIYGLHVDLLLGPAVAWTVGLVGLLWALDHLVASVLAVPRLSRWRDAFGVAGPAGSLRRTFDAHRAVGMWAFPATLTLAVSGAVLAWPEISRDAVRSVAPVSDRLHEHWPDAEPPPAPITLEAAMASVAARDNIDSVRLFPDHAAYAVRTFDPRDLDEQGRLWTYVAMGDGRILGRRHDRGEGGGDLFFAWQYPLHSGQAFGLPGRIAVAAAGLATVFLAVGGIELWLRRRRLRTPRPPGPSPRCGTDASPGSSR